jgi:hypothetical protein
VEQEYLEISENPLQTLMKIPEEVFLAQPWVEMTSTDLIQVATLSAKRQKRIRK